MSIQTGICNEEWKPIKAKSGYSVSNVGRVRNDVSRRIITQHFNINGYLRVAIGSAKDRSNFSVHRLVLVAFNDIGKSGYQVNHKNGVKTDNRVENLEWATASENIRHAYIKLGRRSSLARLKESDVRFILENRWKISSRKLGKMFGVSHNNVLQIQHGKSWKRLQNIPLNQIEKEK